MGWMGRTRFCKLVPVRSRASITLLGILLFMAAFSEPCAAAPGTRDFAGNLRFVKDDRQHPPEARYDGLKEGKGRKKKANRDAEARRDHAEVEAKRLLDCGLELLGLEAAELERLPRADERKLALAALIRSRTTGSNGWPAAALRMGHPSRVTTSLRMPKTHTLRCKLEAALAS